MRPEIFPSEFFEKRWSYSTRILQMGEKGERERGEKSSPELSTSCTPDKPSIPPSDLISTP
jgi:hypothetical protein